MANLSNINNKFLVTTGGNVGINVTSPTTGRFVVNTTSGVAAAFGRDGTDGDVVQIYNGVAGTTKVVALGASGNDGTIYSQYGNLLLQSAAGNVGIGTVSPDSKLDVTGGDITVNTAGIGFMNFKYGSAGSESTMGSIQTTGVDLKINATSDLLLLPGSNVGIGTASPGAKLDVHVAGTGIRQYGDANNILSTYAGSGYQVLEATNSGTTNAFGYNSGAFYVETAATERIRIDSAGNVGIGTSPNSYSNYTTLTIGNASGTGSILDIEYQTIRTLAVYAASNGGNINVITAKPLILLTSGAERMRIDSSGNVGIGTTGPTAKLHIAKTTTWGEMSNPIINIQNNGTGGNINTTHNMGSITWLSGSVSTAEIKAVRNTPASGDNVELRFSTSSAGVQGERMTINNVGNVGIGVTDPDAQLEIVNSLGGSTRLGYLGGSDSYFDSENFYVRSGNGNTNKFIINSSGNVGIGTTSPDSLLEISKAQASGPILKLKEPTAINGTIEGGPGNNLGVLGFVSADSSTSQANLIRASVEGQPGEKPYGTGGLLTFNTMQTYSGSGTLTDLIERMRITSTGAISVGSTGTAYGTSGQVLTSNGNASPSWQAAGGSSPWTTTGNDIYNNNSGSIGIGVSSPVAKLDVNGDCSYEDVNTGTTTVTTATKTLEFTVFLDGGSASLGVTYQLLSMEQPQYNTSVAVATMEYGASLDSGTGRVGGSVMAVTKWAGNWYQEDNIELGFAGTTSGKPSLFWEYGDLKVTAQRYCNMVCRIRLTYRGFGSSTTSPVTKNYPT
jgi:hypothetical protein